MTRGGFTAESVSVGSFSDAARGAPGTVVVIDVFRAFTTAAVALAQGAGRVVMVDDLQQALDLRARTPGSLCIGERGGLKPPGFDFGNSPAEFRGADIAGRTLIQTTSNGTRGILAARGAARIYAGALVTAEATVRAIAAGGHDPVRIVAMGQKDSRRTEEDEICALYLRSRLLGRHPDRAATCRLIETMSTRSDTRRLSKADLASCLDFDSVPFAVRVTVEDGLHVAQPEFPPA
ncbi:MAG TPA: 2-phosphosulfolactate phosphatase [Thermohalobaculum sp.]|nr:2-phosphosulfolactate phosphatase [Thermohalobaculum sp.]